LEKNQNCLVYVTVKDESEGLSIAQKVVEKRLAACANLYPQIKSIFNYQNQAVLILKTTAQAYDKLESFIIEIHSYDDPCVLKLPIEGGAADFMSWIKDTVAS
jgi:periplasmic divalent cation tolerance protein